MGDSRERREAEAAGMDYVDLEELPSLVEYLKAKQMIEHDQNVRQLGWKGNDQ